ncbi:Cag pathogenicity island protein Cag12 [Salmonella enterica]|nr:Cag pathogenicity island protein Cag12 [Salmonella enterica]HAU2970423.1 Cag pathogenicity island protein Cag12 [Salmonella enterica subsp. diarizonae]
MAFPHKNKPGLNIILTPGIAVTGKLVLLEPRENTRLPQWSDNNVIVPSPTVNGKWTSSISAQSFHDTIWSPSVFYTVAHSTRIVVTAQSGADFFNAKNWLRQNGAKGVIEYQPLFNCLTCRETTIYLSRQSI